MFPAVFSPTFPFRLVSPAYRKPCVDTLTTTLAQVLPPNHWMFTRAEGPAEHLDTTSVVTEPSKGRCVAAPLIHLTFQRELGSLRK